MGGKCGNESDEVSVSDHYGNMETGPEREIEDVSVTGEMKKKPDTEHDNKSVEENIEKGLTQNQIMNLSMDILYPSGMQYIY